MAKRLWIAAITTLGALVAGAYVWTSGWEDAPSISSIGAVPGVSTSTVGPAKGSGQVPTLSAAENRAPDFPKQSQDLWKAPERLFDIYRAGIDSADAKRRYMAREALNVCLPFAMKQPFPEAANRRSENAAELARTRAILERACRKFASVPVVELVRQRNDMIGMTQNSEFPVNPAIAELGRSPTERNVREAKEALRIGLSDSGGGALLWLAPALSEWIEYSAISRVDSLAQELRDTINIGSAVFLSQCSLSYDCGPSSIPYLNICSSTGICTGSLESYFLSGLNAEEQEKVRRQAAVISSSVLRKDLAALAL